MLELFPTAVLDTSILTSVLVGLLVVWVLQEWLGWGLTALVVPGYLASVLVIQPATAGVIVLEAIASWLFMVALSDALPRWWPWFPLFGRDRFFLALLGSVAVRLGMEAGLFPLLDARFGLRFASELHSMGLVVVPLLAYAIWRNGPVRSLPRLGIPILVTWLILDQLLLSRTNLSLSSFELTYEDLALDFVSSPRAYILLLAGAWLGSLTNLRYGWDFGGIIVPGLLALCWLQPERLAATIGEAVLISLALQLVLKAPGLGALNLTGGRLLVLGVLIGYLLKYGLGHVVGAGWPGLRLRQLFGFGYLLPTLMALRIVRSGDPFRTLVPSLLTSFGGFAGGTTLAYLLAVAMPGASPPQVPVASTGEGAAAALRAAWINEGPVPLDLESVVDRGEATLVQAGGGFGALWLRGEGNPVLVSARVGTPGVGEAALAVAQDLDARGVLLCAPTGSACGEARRRLGFQLPILVVEAGSLTRLQLTEPFTEGLAALPEPMPGVPESAGVQARLEGRVGKMVLTAPEGEATLTLAPGARMRVAASWRGIAPGPWEHPAWAPLEPKDPPDAGTLDLLRASLAAPLVDWARQAEHGDAALGLAAGTADLLGARLTTDGERVSVVAPDWRLLVQQGATPTVIEAPFADDAPGLLSLALSLHESMLATATIADAPPLWRNEVHATGRAAHHVLLGLLEELGEDARVVSVEELRDLQDPDADVVLSVGRPVSAGQPPPDLTAELHRRLEALGLAVRLFDGTAARLAFRDGGHPGRNAAFAATGREAQTTIFAGSLLRARTVPIDGLHPLHDVLMRADLPLWSVERGTLVGHSLLDQAGPEARSWGDWQEQAARFAVSGRPSDLAELSRMTRRSGARLGLACDPVVGCRWLAALRCRDDVCSGIVRGVAATPSTSLPPGPPSEFADAPRDRLLLGDGALVLEGMPAPPPLPPASPATP